MSGIHVSLSVMKWSYKGCESLSVFCCKIFVLCSI